jgi:predicted nucleic acid-binding protein
MIDSIFLDPSFVTALINDKDQYHEQAEKISYKFENPPLITADAVLLEIGNALARSFRQEAAAVIKILRHSSAVEIVEISAELFEEGLQIYEKFADKQWGLVDCLSFSLM